MASSSGHTESVGDHMVDVAEHSGGMPQLDFSTWPSQIFWAALALLLLYFVLAKRIMPKIGGALENRHNAIANDLDRAAQLKIQAENAEASYEQALSDARARAGDIADKTKAEIASELDEATAKAEAQIAARTAEGEARIGEIKASAAANAKSIALDAASDIVEKLAPGLGGSDAVSAAVEKALSGGRA